MIRFFTHLCLRLIDIQVSPFATQIIFEAYLRVLEHASQRELIAMYAGALGDNAVERYALFLTSLELAGDATERRLALARAREQGLDIERIVIVTAERTIEKTFTVLRLSPKHPEKSVGIEKRCIGQILPPAKAPAVNHRARTCADRCGDPAPAVDRVDDVPGSWSRRTTPRSSRRTSSSDTFLVERTYGASAARRGGRAGRWRGTGRSTPQVKARSCRSKRESESSQQGVAPATPTNTAALSRMRCSLTFGRATPVTVREHSSVSPLPDCQ